MTNFIEELNSALSLFLVLAGIYLAIRFYIRWRGSNFGRLDLLLFGPLAAAADFGVFWLYRAAAGPHADSAAWGALSAMLILFGVWPIAAVCTILALSALVKCLIRYPAIRWLTLAIVLLAWLAHYFYRNIDQLSAPGALLNNDKVAGENWALESGAASKADCDRQSTSASFRTGCYRRIQR